LTEIQWILGAFALVLIMILAMAAFLDGRIAKASPDRDSRSGREFSFILRSTGSDEGNESVSEEASAHLISRRNQNPEQQPHSPAYPLP
jgi:hypothetical protein